MLTIVNFTWVFSPDQCAADIGHTFSSINKSCSTEWFIVDTAQKPRMKKTSLQKDGHGLFHVKLKLLEYQQSKPG